MVKGFNSDLNVRGKQYHVQTEDWGDANPFLVTRVFLNGAVLKTFKVPHEQALMGASLVKSEGLKHALRQLHTQVIDALMEGRL